MARATWRFKSLDARFVLADVGRGLIGRGLEPTRIDLEQHVAGLHLGAVRKLHLVEVAADAGRISTVFMAAVRPVNSSYSETVSSTGVVNRTC